MSDFSQTVPELVAWARKNDFSIQLPVDKDKVLQDLYNG